MTEAYPFCSAFRAYYPSLVHGYLSLAICTVGILCNLFNILIFSRKNMHSPVNAILLLLSILDFTLLLEYIPCAYWRIAIAIFTYAWDLYRFFFIIVSSTTYAMCVWLTVLLAVYRSMAVIYPFKSGIWSSTKKTYILALCLCSVNLVFLVPIYRLSYVFADKDDTSYYKATHLFSEEELVFQYWWTAYIVVIILIPSVLMSVVISRLILNLLSATGRRKQIFNNAEHRTIERRTDRTNKMLLIILILFLLALLPRLVVNPLTIHIDEEFNVACFPVIWEVTDIVTYLDMSVTFFVHYIMSHQFRTTLKSLLRK